MLSAFIAHAQASPDLWGLLNSIFGWGNGNGNNHNKPTPTPQQPSLPTVNLTPLNGLLGLGNNNHKPTPAPTTTTPVSYNGPGITGTAQLPPSLSKVVFPTNSVRFGIPGFNNGKLGQNILPQGKTNGWSWLGTFNAPKLPPFVGGWGSGSNTNGAPWGGRTAKGTNPYTSAPKTGVTRSYTFTIGRAIMAPDGVQREVLVVNNQFPGPTIEANWGDTISVTVVNNITGPAEGTAFHWHGLLQTHTEYEDGVPGISQCPIAPGETFTYTFNADLYGTSWWHSHYSAQYAGGAFGPMIIHGPFNANYDYDLGPVLLSDYYHQPYYQVLERVMGTDLSVAIPFSQNNLINGKNNYNCSLITDGTPCTPNAGLSKFQFISGKTYRLRLINGGAEGIQRFSIDNHTMQVIANDFVPITPYATKVVTLGVGQRADVLVTANGNPSSSYWMRSSISTNCSLAYQPDAYAIIYYQNADTTSQPKTTSWPIDDSYCGNDPLPSSVPYYAMKPPTTNATVNVNVAFEINSTGNFIWTIDGSSYRTDYNNPVLPILQSDNSSAAIAALPREWNIYNFGSNKSFIIVVNNQNPIAHPFHIHGHNMFILSQGYGSWNGQIQGNPNNPARRDVQLLPPSGYIAIQVIADNPGVWPFHCHIAWHVSGGLYMNILERPADIPSWIQTPQAVDDLCTKWDSWTTTGYVNQIDSGVKVRRDLTGSELFSENKVRSHMRRHSHSHVRHGKLLG